MQIVALDTTTPQLRAPPSGSTYWAPRAIVMTPDPLTGSSAVSSLGITQTWNTTGTPTALRLDVTDTASNVASLLMDLRMGGVSRFRVRKDGEITTAVQAINGYRFYANVGGVTRAAVHTWTNDNIGRVYVNAAGTYSWSPTADALAAADLFVARDAANTLAQRNGVNAQTSRVYGTFTDASNHRRLVLAMSAAGVAEVKPEGAGTGASGNVLHISGLPTSNPGPGILWNNAGTPAIGT